MSTSEELRKLEVDLKKDFDSDKALRDRIREQIKRYLMLEAGRLTNTRPQESKDIDALLTLYYKVALLQKAIDNPRSTSPREFKELIQSTPGRADGPAPNPLDFIDKLAISDEDKATLMGSTLELAKARAREELNQ